MNTLPGRSVPRAAYGPIKAARGRVDIAKYQMSASPFPHCVTSPSPDRALRHVRAARFFLVSGSLRADARGLYLQPDGLWARTFGADEGWYVAEWPDIAVVQLRQGGRYSLLRSRLRVLDAFGRVLFRAEVAHAEARTMFGATRLVEEPESGILDNRRYVGVLERVH